MSRVKRISIVALVILGVVTLLGAPADARGNDFLRGDANSSGKVDISDAVFVLQFLFLGGAAPDLADAADANDDGTLDLSDSVAILMALFLEGGDLPPPGMFVAGPDPTPDDLPDPEKVVALLYVGHGEPSAREDGDIPITLADGTPFGPHGASLGVPESAQYTEWAAAYEEIATAMTYLMGDVNGNGVLHEIEIAPDGDVPPFFTWDAFHETVFGYYEAVENYSPHNDSLREHVESLDIEVDGARIDLHLAFLDAVPRIRDVVWEITSEDRYDELVVVPMLLSRSTHTQEVEDLVREAAHLTGGLEVLVTEPFFEVPYVRRRVRNAVASMAEYVRGAVPFDAADAEIGVLLASHGTPYVPPFPVFGWKEGEIFSFLLLTEDAFHDEIGQQLPWESRTGRMSFSSPTIQQTLGEFDADGFSHVIVVSSAFPTAAIHTMWDVPDAALGRAVLNSEGIVVHERPSGMQVHYSAEGFADIEPGRSEFRAGLAFLGRMGVIEALEEETIVPGESCAPGDLCVRVTADDVVGSELRLMLYEVSDEEWPGDFQEFPTPSWVVLESPPVPDRYPVDIRIPFEESLFKLTGGTLEGARLGLAIVTGDGSGTTVEPTDARGFSRSTRVYQAGSAMDFGTIELEVPSPGNVCEPGELCVTVTARETTGEDLRLLLYEASEDEWPQRFRSLPTPGWVVKQSPPVPDEFPIHIRIPLVPLEESLFPISTAPLEGARVGLAVVTGVASTFIVEPTDARGFSATTLVYQPDAIMDFGAVELTVPQGDTCDLNPFHPSCLTGGLFWREHFLGQEDFVPGAIYMAHADVDRDGTNDIVTVGEPHFENPDLPLTVLRLGIYYLEKDFTVRETEIVDAWTEDDQAFYSPWGVQVIDHGGEPMIIVGTNIPGLAPLREGSGAIFSYRKVEGAWERSVVMENPNPTEINYNAMIVVIEDIDNDGDQDLALSSAFGSSAVGSWMENTGQVDAPWIPHLQTIAPDTDPAIRGALAYKSVDLNGDGYPEVVYNGMFDVPGTNPPSYRGEIWLGVNPGPEGWDERWEKIVIDDDNWASADMWFHDFDGDGHLDLIANQIFSSTVTLYRHPGEDLRDPWVPEVIISDLTSPSDMWLADIDDDGLVDVVSADHTAHRGVWHRNPGPASADPWRSNLIFRNIRLPGDFAMSDLDEDGDLDWMGISLTLGQAYIVEQVEPATSLVATISLPDGFTRQMTKLLVTLALEVPVTGVPVAILATIDNVDRDGDGELDLDQILGPSRDLVLAIEDVGVRGEYHVVTALYMEGGGQFMPVPGVDYLASSEKLTLGQGKVETKLDLELVPGP